MKLLRNSILIMAAIVALVHLLGSFQIVQISDNAHATNDSQEKLPIF